MTELKKIGVRIRVLLANGNVKNFKEIFPLDATPKSKCIVKSRDYRLMKKLKVHMWGLQTVYNTPTGEPPIDRAKLIEKQ